MATESSSYPARSSRFLPRSLANAASIDLVRRDKLARAQQVRLRAIAPPNGHARTRAGPSARRDKSQP